MMLRITRLHVPSINMAAALIQNIIDNFDLTIFISLYIFCNAT